MIITKDIIYTESNYDKLVIYNSSIIEESYMLLYETEKEINNIKELLFENKLSILTESIQIVNEGAIWDKIKEIISNFKNTVIRILTKFKNWVLSLFKKSKKDNEKENIEEGKKAAKEGNITPEQEKELNENSDKSEGYTYKAILNFDLSVKNNEMKEIIDTLNSVDEVDQEWVKTNLQKYKKDLIKSFINNSKSSFTDNEINDPKDIFLSYLRGEKIDNIYNYYLKNDTFNQMKILAEGNLKNIDAIKFETEEMTKKDNQTVETLKSKNFSENKIKIIVNVIQITETFFNKAIAESAKAAQEAIQQIENAEKFFIKINNNPDLQKNIDKEKSKPNSDYHKAKTSNNKQSNQDAPINKYATKYRKGSHQDAFVKMLDNNNSEDMFKYVMVDSLDVDPTHLAYIDWYRAGNDFNFWDKHTDLTPFKQNKSEWNDDYWVTLKVDFLENASKKRFDHMKDVAKVVLADKLKKIVDDRGPNWDPYDGY